MADEYVRTGELGEFMKRIDERSDHADELADQRFKTVDQRFLDMEKRMKQGFAHAEKAREQNFVHLNQRFDGMNDSVNQRFDGMQAEIRSVRNTMLVLHVPGDLHLLLTECARKAIEMGTERIDQPLIEKHKWIQRATFDNRYRKLPDGIRELKVQP